MINVYSPTETNFKNNGLATLIPISCDYGIGINDKWQLTMEHPFDKELRYQHLVENAFLRVTGISCVNELDQDTDRFGLNGKVQLFRIFDIKKTLTSITVIAFSIGLEAVYDTPIENLVIKDKTGIEAGNILNGLTEKYNVSSDITRTDSSQYENTNLIGAISGNNDDSYINKWGGEVVYDNYKIKIKNKIGDQNNASAYPIRYGRNLTGLSHEIDMSSVVTRIFPISSDDLRLNVWEDVTSLGGNRYVDSTEHISDYPFIRCMFIEVDYSLLDTNSNSISETATATNGWREGIINAVTAQATALWTSIIQDLTNTYSPEYIQDLINGEDGIVGYLQKKYVYAHKGWQSFVKSCAKQGVEWIKDENLPTWEWHENTSVIPHAWWYGDNSVDPAVSYAKNEYVKIGKNYEYFNNDGYWEDYKAMPHADCDWYEAKDGSGRKWFGYRKGYYAHNEYVYMTVEGQMKEWWYDEEGWYDESRSGDSDMGWHGDATSGYWFGESDATSEDTNKFLHDRWAWIDGNYYWFDQYGYISGELDIPDYPWFVIETTQGSWFGNDQDEMLGAKWFANQWAKIDGEWYYFDADGYVVDMTAKQSETIAWFANTVYNNTIEYITTCLTNAYTLLYRLMREWCEKQYADGIDLPTVNVSVDLIDLSKTTEYKDYSNLEKISLGDKVLVIGRDGSRYEERVVGLTFDCIRGYNTQIEVGQLSKSVSQIINVSYSGASEGQKIIAGDGVTIDGKVISVGDYVGRTIGLQDVLLNGSTCVSGNVANFGITEGSHVHISRNGNILTISADSGALEYFIETENTLYGHDTTTKYLRNDINYKFDSGVVMHNYSQRDDIDHSYYKHTASNVDNNDIVGYHAGKIDSLLSAYADVATGFCIISKVASHCTFTYEYFNSQYPTDESSPTYSYTYSYDSANRNVTTSLPSRMSDVSATCDTFTYNNETYYIVADGATWDWISPQTNIEDILDLGKYVKEFEDNYTIQNEQGTNVFNTLGEYGLAVVKAHTQRNSYNGIAKKDGLAFFAGGTDANGSDAPIKIYDDGTAKGLVTEVDLDKKQDKLIEGTNIQIGADGKTISATDTDEIAELEDVSLTNLADGEILKYNATTQKWENAEDSGGSEVEANPSGTSTDTLTKLGIDGTIYEIQGGGGSNLIVDAQIYSLEEKQIGVWVDGRPLYQKTFITNVTLTSGVWTATGDSVLNGKAIDAEVTTIGQGSDTIPVWCEIGADGHIELLNIRGSGQVTITHYTVRYFKTTDAVGSGGYQAYGFSPIIYSEEEREIGVWINNKPLYQKTLVFENYTNGTYQDVSSLNIEEVVNNFGEHRLADYSYGLSFPYYENNNWYSLMTFDKNNGRYCVYCSSQMADTYKKLFITIQYTKTTDVAGSGEYNTLGVPNVHYDGNEKIIGTWFGETLYENYIDLGSLTIISPNGVQIDIGSIDVKQPVNAFGIYDLAIAEARTMPLLWWKYNGNMYFSNSTQGACNKLILQYTKTS